MNPNPQAYDHAAGFRDTRGHFLDGNAAGCDVVQVGCDLAHTYRLVRKMCPFYLACESRFRGKSWECNHGRTDAEYISCLAAKGLRGTAYLPLDREGAALPAAPAPDSPPVRDSARSLRFVRDLPAYVGYMQGERAFRAAGMGSRTTFGRLWKLRKGGT